MALSVNGKGYFFCFIKIKALYPSVRVHVTRTYYPSTTGNTGKLFLVFENFPNRSKYQNGPSGIYKYRRAFLSITNPCRFKNKRPLHFGRGHILLVYMNFWINSGNTPA
jgi:hypothetical protein